MEVEGIIGTRSAEMISVVPHHAVCGPVITSARRCGICCTARGRSGQQPHAPSCCCCLRWPLPAPSASSLAVQWVSRHAGPVISPVRPCGNHSVVHVVTPPGEELGCCTCRNPPLRWLGPSLQRETLNTTCHPRFFFFFPDAEIANPQLDV